FWRIGEGPTPSKLSEAAPSELHRLLGLFEQVCRTVAHAHSRNVIHRDLKPSNIMIGAFGEGQVMDWGLAKDLRGADPVSDGLTEAGSGVRDEAEPGFRTRWGVPIGTLPYSPPEQVRGELERVDARADVFGLGAILCELLTGQPPYIGKKAEVLAQA